MGRLTQVLQRVLLYPHRLLPMALRAHRDAVAFADGTTFGGLLDRVDRLAGYWHRQGLVPGARVLIDLGNSAAFVEARLAAIRAGLVAVPIPPDTSDTRLGWIAEFTEATGYLGRRPQCVPGLDAVGVDPVRGDSEAYEYALAHAAPLGSSPRIRGHQLLTLNFTSGTTGEPKGVMSTVAAWGWSLYCALRENRVPVTRDEVFLHAVPLATAGSTLILPAVLSGAKSSFLASWDAVEAARRIEEEHVTRVFLTPTMLAELVDAVRQLKTDVSSLRAVIYGTEGVPVARVRKALQTLGPVLQQGYGMAEALPPVCILHQEEHRRGLENDDEVLLGSCGRPTRAVALTVTDDTGHELPPREKGMVQVAGRTVSPGYWKRPELTAATRRSGAYITGDLGSIDDQGYLHVAGRLGHLPPPRARRAVETLEARDDVCLAWIGSEDPALVFHVVPARGSAPTPEGLQHLLESQGVAEGTVTLEDQAPKTPSYKLHIR